MTPDEVRERYLRFFEKRGHTIWPSASLVPQNDLTLLFTGAGMNQFKDMFLGVGNLPFSRATTSQKCLRTGDLDNVGVTPYHHTFFEMLGNFSFGDYFKREAISWAHEFLVSEMGVDPARLSASVYEKDDEAYGIWRDVVKLPAERIHRFGAKDNFWPSDAPTAGPNGPCGPCSEIFYDHGLRHGCGKPTCDPSCDCPRYCEVWNLVFTQFDRRDGGELKPLPRKNIDTGMGFERMVSVVEGVATSYDTTLFSRLLDRIAAVAKSEYRRGDRSGTGQKIRRIADHVRGAAFCVADGVTPSNEGRGYVLRKIIRRAVSDGRQLGVSGEFLHELVPAVTEVMGGHYTELREHEKAIVKFIRREEERFSGTYATGVEQLEKMVAELPSTGAKTLPGAKAFLLYDTFGFPLDIAERILADRKVAVDRDGFERAMEEQREKARKKAKMAGDIFKVGPIQKIKQSVAETEFLGFDSLRADATALALLTEEDAVSEAGEAGPQRVRLVVDRTPFYSEAGGQVGDTGLVVGGSGFEARVVDTQKVEGYALHEIEILRGAVRVGDRVALRVDEARRRGIMRNHTATHLLHKALHEVLGEDALQAGSLVEERRLRFDFTHPRAVGADEIREIEERVNSQIVLNTPVTTEITDYKTARSMGAMALFGEKYGDRVRLVRIADYSLELCGGTHVRSVGDIGAFLVASESSIAAGVRRIEAISGPEAIERAQGARDALRTIATLLKVGEGAVVDRVKSILDEAKALKHEVSKEKRRAAGDVESEIRESAETLDGVTVIVKSVPGLDVKDIRDLADRLRRSSQMCAVALGSARDGRVHLVVGCSDSLARGGFDSGAILKRTVAVTGGGGGGRKDFAHGQGADPARLDAALGVAREAIVEVISALA